MPNHVINELIFRGVDEAKQAAVLAKLCDSEGKVDFNILVPAPLNMWWWSVGQKHEQAFKRTHLDWARENWGTKWNAYDHRPVERDAETLTIRFETAWGPPYPWLAAVFNSLGFSFEHNWLSEGGLHGFHAIFSAEERDDIFGDPWKEEPADPEMERHLQKLLWGESLDEPGDAA